MIQLRIPEVRSGVRSTLLVCAAILPGLSACSHNASPSSDSGDIVIGSGSDSEVLPGNGAENSSTAARFGVPPGHLPPVGQCRVWMPGEPPGQQGKKYPVGQCSNLRRSIPVGGWLIYRPTDSEREVRVWEYGSNLEVLSERVYDTITGELLRHITPPS